MLVTILANGERPRHAAPLSAIAGADVLVACDGAFASAREIGRLPDYVVGDGDSLAPEERTALGHRFIFAGEQDTNDLCKAFRFIQSLQRTDGGKLSVRIVGATGLREDHALANIFHLVDFTEAIPDTSILTNSGTFTAVRGEMTFPCRAGDAISVFAPSPFAHVSSHGLEWPLDGIGLTQLWRGTLNRTTGESFTLDANRPILLYRPYSN